MSVAVEEKKVESVVDYVITEEDVADLKRVDASQSGYRIWKRGLDIILSFIGLTVLLLPILIISIIVFIDDPGEIFFCQDRVGKGNKTFRLFKFRTMRMDTPKYMPTGEFVDASKYITRAGKILRKLSLDEIPQLVNVLLGDMSLVGPRPLIPGEKPIHDMRERFGVYTVRPGVTGLAQVNGRDTVQPADKVRYDVKYVEQFGFVSDVKILVATVPKVFSGNGVVEGKHNKQ